MLTINASDNGGGGQIVRSALALSKVTGQAVTLRDIRASRPRPGLMRQHLTALRAAATICNAQVQGDHIGSREVVFTPGAVKGGAYHFAVGTAGSATLVLQTVLPALMLADAPSELVLEGGTHNPFAPPFDYLQKVYVPLVNRMGPRVEVSLEQAGFYPAGGGRFTARITPVKKLEPLELHERGEIVRMQARALVANLPGEIAVRELARIKQKLNWTEDCLKIEQVKNAAGPGNVVMIELACEHVTEIVTSFGEVDRSAEAVANDVVSQYARYKGKAGAAGEHLTDQLMLPMAIAGAGSFTSIGLSLHAQTHLALIQQMLDVKVNVMDEKRGCHRISFGGC